MFSNLDEIQIRILKEWSNNMVLLKYAEVRLQVISFCKFIEIYGFSYIAIFLENQMKMLALKNVFGSSWIIIH